MPDFEDSVYARAYNALQAKNAAHRARNAHAWKWVIAALVCGCFVVALFATRSHDRPPLLSPDLKLYSTGPNLLISWSGLPPETSHPELHVVDGGTITDIEIKGREKSGGQTLYRRRTARVEVLLLTQDGRNTAAHMLFTSQQPAPLSTPIATGDSELEQLKARNRRLETLVSILRQRAESQSKH